MPTREIAIVSSKIRYEEIRNKLGPFRFRPSFPTPSSFVGGPGKFFHLKLNEIIDPFQHIPNVINRLKMDNCNTTSIL